MDKEELVTLLPFNHLLSDKERNALKEHISFLHFPKGKTIHYGSWDCTGVMFVRSGSLRTYLLSEEGRDITLFILAQKDVCMLSATCILDSINFDITIDAEKDTDIIQVDADVFRKLIDENLALKVYALELTNQRFSDVMKAMQRILFFGIDERLALFLLEQSKRSGLTDIALTHGQIAKYISSSREVVSRRLSALSHAGMVSLHRCGVRITNPTALKALTQDV